MQTQPDPPRPTWNGNIEVDAQRVPPATAMRLKPAPSRNGEWGDVVKPGSVRTGLRQADWYCCDGRRREERRLETPFAGGRRRAQAGAGGGDSGHDLSVCGASSCGSSST